MKKRGLLQSQIISAWHECITEDYCIQRINSERSLQASFWSRLNTMFSKNRRMFIEPCIIIKARKEIKRLFPDLVICNTKEVIGVIELKYQPRGGPNYLKDITTLSNIAKHRKFISISNERFRGQFVEERIYGLSKNILFVWAGIHTAANPINNDSLPLLPLYSAGYNELKDCFIELHAETSLDSLPKIYSRS